MEQRTIDPVTRHMLQNVSDAVARIFVEADADIAARRPVCHSSGRCCHFDAWGHHLYVTTAELLHFLSVHIRDAFPEAKIKNQKSKIENRDPSSLSQLLASADPAGCPFQSGTFCTARAARPLGCRVYFCDPAAESWQNEVYEKYHAQLGALHEQFGVPYRYLEWRAALRLVVQPLGCVAGLITDTNQPEGCTTNPLLP
jgi:Fe-S-cluster containining protein